MGRCQHFGAGSCWTKLHLACLGSLHKCFGGGDGGGRVRLGKMDGGQKSFELRGGGDQKVFHDELEGVKKVLPNL